MTFTIEIDGETIIQHQINEQGEITRSRFHEERKLAKEIIDKMNEFYSERWIDKNLGLFLMLMKNNNDNSFQWNFN